MSGGAEDPGPPKDFWPENFLLVFPIALAVICAAFGAVLAWAS